jgi:hypothetical protein
VLGGRDIGELAGAIAASYTTIFSFAMLFCFTYVNVKSTVNDIQLFKLSGLMVNILVIPAAFIVIQIVSRYVDSFIVEIAIKIVAAVVLMLVFWSRYLARNYKKIR